MSEFHRYHIDYAVLLRSVIEHLETPASSALGERHVFVAGSWLEGVVS